MKNSFFKTSLLLSFLFILIISFSSYESNAQSFFNVDEIEKRHFYFSANVLKVKHFTQATKDAYFGTYSNYDNAIMMILGYQLHKNIAIEASLISSDLLFASAIGDRFIHTTGSSSRIDYFSLGISNKLALITNRFFITSKVGLTLGRRERSSGSLRRQELQYGDLSVMSETLTYSLVSGKNHNFINVGIGLECNITNRIACTIGYNHIQGFKDIIQKEINYEVNGEIGDVRLVSSGSIAALDIGIKYSFK